jgi:hypothetical protein
MRDETRNFNSAVDGENRRAILGTHDKSYIRTKCIKHLFWNGSDVLRPRTFRSADLT